LRGDEDVEGRMTKLSGVVAGSLMVAAFLPLGSAIGRGQTITPDPTGMFAGLPPQAPDAVRLGVIAATDIQVHVTIRPKTMRCDDLEAHVQILQNGATHTESYACFGVQHPNALTELVVGRGPGRHYYTIAFDYSKPNHSVTYTVRRIAGVGIIESQTIVVDVATGL
jgi:hypothetical protein